MGTKYDFFWSCFLFLFLSLKSVSDSAIRFQRGVQPERALSLRRHVQLPDVDGEALHAVQHNLHHTLQQFLHEVIQQGKREIEDPIDYLFYSGDAFSQNKIR